MSYEYKSGLGNSSAYVVSGKPYMSASITVPALGGTPLRVDFPAVTQLIRIHNHDSTNPLRVGFSSAGVTGSNYWIIDNEDANGKGRPYGEFRVRADSVFLLGHVGAVTTAIVYAELTSIVLDYNLVDSYTGSVGV